MPTCPGCGSEDVWRHGTYRRGHTRTYRFKCNACGVTFTDPELQNGGYSEPIREMGAYLTTLGFSTREASLQLNSTYKVDVDPRTVANWAEAGGVTLTPRRRSKPCRNCDSFGRHRRGCPLRGAEPELKIPMY